MLVKNKISVLCFAILTISSVSLSLGGYYWSVHKAHHEYRIKLQASIETFMQKQQNLLQRLGKQLIQPIKQNSENNIALRLRIFEDLIFTMAKQGLTVPVNVHYVSLTAPAKIIASNGITDTRVLSPDDNYYMRAVADPNKLVISAAYIKTEMPDYSMCNWGLGIVDDKYLGHLDVKVALPLIAEYITAKLDMRSNLFSFKLNTPNIYMPKVMLNKNILFAHAILVALIAFIVSALAYYIVYKVYLLRIAIKLQNKMLRDKNALNADLDAQVLAYKAYTAVQNEYGLLTFNPTATAEQIVEVGKLLQDVKNVNLPLAMQRGVQINLPYNLGLSLGIFANRVRLMQILSGIVYEILMQLSNGSLIEIQVSVNEQANAKQTIVFKFVDNGFYNRLQDSMVQNSNADIRMCGWANLRKLIAMENGSLEYVHTAYHGNSITFSLTVAVRNNVVRLEEYLQ